jgi:hypothetical protein
MLVNLNNFLTSPFNSRAIYKTDPILIYDYLAYLPNLIQWLVSSIFFGLG